jgi:hypothetical protein
MSTLGDIMGTVGDIMGTLGDIIALNYSSNKKRFRQICRENQNTNFMFNSLFSENYTVYDIMWNI